MEIFPKLLIGLILIINVHDVQKLFLDSCCSTLGNR